MEEANPWLDNEVVKHKNVKAVKPVIKETKEIIIIKETKETKEVFIKEAKEREQIFISSLNKDKHNDFLKVLLGEFNINIPKNSRKFAIDNFGEKWLEDFLKDVDELKRDLLQSSFFPNQKEMIFLKYIFLLQQF